MKRHAFVAALAIALTVPAIVHGGEWVAYETPRPHFLHRLAPVGGCNPGGGLFHWWDPTCLPGACGPNTYCRKPYPNVCRYPIAPNCTPPCQVSMPAPPMTR